MKASVGLVILGVVVACVLLFCCLIVGSDYDDQMGYDDEPSE
jgi:hypothetical protein